VAGSAAFQAAGVAETPFRGFRFALPPTGTREAGKMPALPGGLG